MEHQIQIVNPKKHLQSFHDLSCGKISILKITSEDILIPYFEIGPPDGFNLPENFPECCEFHKGLIRDANDFYNKFPNCCEYHKNLHSKPWFKKENYSNVALKVVHQLEYVEFHISNHIDNPEWYKEITDYIEYNYYSFGQFPDGHGPAFGLSQFLDNLKRLINETNIVPKKKVPILLTYIDAFYRPKKDTIRDLNILEDTYKRWLKAFPFELSFFGDLKESFSKRLPISNGESSYNPYLGVSKFQLFTETELIKILIQTTKDLLKQIDNIKLFKEGLITDIEKQKLELILEEQRIRQSKLLDSYSKNELTYIKLLKNWLKNEKSYFQDITPYYVRKKTKSNSESVKNLKINEIALKYVYEGKLISKGNSLQIAKSYGHASGNKLYQQYLFFSSTANRKGKPLPCTPLRLKNKINLFEKVISVLETDNKERALDELKILKTIYDSEYL